MKLKYLVQVQDDKTLRNVKGGWETLNRGKPYDDLSTATRRAKVYQDQGYRVRIIRQEVD